MYESKNKKFVFLVLT